MSHDWIDVSVPLRNGMVHWPDNPPFAIERVLSLQHGDPCNVSKITLSVHSGTHMDAPIHFIEDGKGIDAIPLEVCIGQARVLEIEDPVSIKPAELLNYHIARGERILFKTRNSGRCWQTDTFLEDFAYISHEAAQYLAEREVQLVGVDYLSVGGYSKDGPETHKALLGAGIWIVEGLNLAQVQRGTYELLCLPLKIVGSDGTPARALMRPIST